MWRTINDIYSIFKILFGVPTSIDIKNITSDQFNCTVIVSLENNRLKQIIKNEMKLWKYTSSAYMSHVIHKRGVSQDGTEKS